MTVENNQKMHEYPNFDSIDIQLIREIQEDIPLTKDPYGDIAKKIGCPKQEVLDKLHRYQNEGRLKRISIILNHKDSGFEVNGMFVCVVPKEKVEEYGNKLAAISQVSHCYIRKSYPEWPYNLYGMIHGKEQKDVESIVKCFIEDTEICEYKVLYSLKELKKTSMKYFNSIEF